MMTPQMSRVLGKFLMALRQYQADNWDLLNIAPSEPNSLQNRIDTLVVNLFDLYEHLAKEEPNNQINPDNDNPDLYQSIMKFPDQELVGEVLNILRTTPHIPEDERTLLKL